jgi:hypothetical protein
MTPVSTWHACPLSIWMGQWILHSHINDREKTVHDFYLQTILPSYEHRKQQRLTGGGISFSVPAVFLFSHW